MNILVYGWYHHDNLGDDLFMSAFRNLFPQFSFKFVDQIFLSDLANADAVFIGGGSFLGENIKVSNDETYEALKHKKIFYIGVGAETEINIFHYELMKLAKLIAIRSPEHLDKVLEINHNTIVIPDLVYCLQPTFSTQIIPKSVLIIPNISVVPQWNEPHWKHAAWEYFKTEFCQFLDEIVADGYIINFLPFCNNYYLDDNLAASEIIARMTLRDSRSLLQKKDVLSSATDTISQYGCVITQRYHGIILSHMVGVPCLSIVHHDKLKNSPGLTLPFYRINKRELKKQFDQLVHTKVSQFLPIDRDSFVQLQRWVENALCSDQKQ